MGLDGAANAVDDDATDTIRADAIFHGEDRASDAHQAGRSLNSEYGKGAELTGLADDFAAGHFELGHGRAGILFHFAVRTGDASRGNLTEGADLE